MSDAPQWPSGQTQPPQAAQGRADLRAAERSDPPTGRDSPKKLF